MKKCLECDKKIKNRSFCSDKCQRKYLNSPEFIELEEELFSKYQKEMERMKKEWKS